MNPFRFKSNKYIYFALLAFRLETEDDGTAHHSLAMEFKHKKCMNYLEFFFWWRMVCKEEWSNDQVSSQSGPLLGKLSYIQQPSTNVNDWNQSVSLFSYASDENLFHVDNYRVHRRAFDDLDTLSLLTDYRPSNTNRFSSMRNGKKSRSSSKTLMMVTGYGQKSSKLSIHPSKSPRMHPSNIWMDNWWVDVESMVNRRMYSRENVYVICASGICRCKMNKWMKVTPFGFARFINNHTHLALFLNTSFICESIESCYEWKKEAQKLTLDCFGDRIMFEKGIIS